MPQFANPQLVALQSTPPGAISFVTVALKVAGTPAVTVAGFVGDSVTAMVGTIVIMAVPLLVGSAIEVAVAIVGLGEGTTPGAV